MWIVCPLQRAAVVAAERGRVPVASRVADTCFNGAAAYGRRDANGRQHVDELIHGGASTELRLLAAESCVAQSRATPCRALPPFNRAATRWPQKVVDRRGGPHRRDPRLLTDLRLADRRKSLVRRLGNSRRFWFNGAAALVAVGGTPTTPTGWVWSGFNGTAARQLRKTARARGGRARLESRFNGAAAQWPQRGHLQRRGDDAGRETSTEMRLTSRRKARVDTTVLVTGECGGFNGVVASSGRASPRGLEPVS
jgi:hypothetical protein